MAEGGDIKVKAGVIELGKRPSLGGGLDEKEKS